MTAAISQPLFTQPAAATVATPTSVNLSPSFGEKRDYAAELRKQTLACRLRREKLGTRKALTRDQIRTAAGEFDADAKFLSASKRILDTKDPAYKAVTGIIRRAVSFWKSLTTPYPEPGVRLIRKDRVELFGSKLTELSAELNAAVDALQARYADLREQAREKLGDLFNDDDYPNRIDGEFSLDWDFPPIDAPAHLKDIHPELYERECNRIKAKFDEAARLMEQELAAKFADLVEHLAERLKGDVDGKPKTFKNASIENLKEFFEQFKSLDIGGTGTLQHLVNQAQKAVEGVTPDDVRGSDDTRNRVAAQMQEITKQMDALMISRPKRQIDLSEDEE